MQRGLPIGVRVRRPLRVSSIMSSNARASLLSVSWSGMALARPVALVGAQ